MDGEIQLISDGDGVAVIGEPTDVERFLVSEGLPSRELGLKWLRPGLGHAAGLAQTGSEIAANSGRWLKLTEESAQLAKKYGLMTNSKTGLSMGVVQAKGQAAGIKGIVQFVPGSLLASPAALSGAAVLMQQVALQQAMDEIADYLAVIDEKVDDILRAQKDAVLADMIGVDFAIEEAMTIREHTGRVTEITWSKVQASSSTIARTQGYALRQLNALADKLDRNAKIGDLAQAAEEVESTVKEWLAVLARCFQLQDALAVLELDRVLDGSPEDLDRHRMGLRTARDNRLELIAQSTENLLARIDSAAKWANTKVLLHPASSRSVVRSSNHVATGIIDFNGSLGIETGHEHLEAQRWVDAVVDIKDKALETGSDGVQAAMSLGNEGLHRVRHAQGKLSKGMNAFRQALKDEAPEGQSAQTPPEDNREK